MMALDLMQALLPHVQTHEYLHARFQEDWDHIY